VSATGNSTAARRRAARPSGRRRLCLWGAGLIGLGCLLPDGRADSAAADEAARVQQQFVHALRRYQSNPTNAEWAWQLGRACFDRAEFATNQAERARLAEQGLAACRQALARDTNSAAAHYYLAMNLGQLARAHTFGALKRVAEMEAEFQLARSLEEQFDWAGPDRNLGLLYLQAPGWPTSIGSKARARQHLRRAAELAPQYPENLLNLVEALCRWGDRDLARRTLQQLEKLWPVARTNLTGEAWSAAWRDWERRLEVCRRKLAGPSAVLRSPHHQD